MDSQNKAYRAYRLKLKAQEMKGTYTTCSRSLASRLLPHSPYTLSLIPRLHPKVNSHCIMPNHVCKDPENAATAAIQLPCKFFRS